MKDGCGGSIPALLAGPEVQASDRLAELVDLGHAGRHRAARRLPDEACAQSGAQDQHAEEREPPILGLDARRTDTLIAGLAGSLVGVSGSGVRP
jgi:hypothetical protein